MNVAASPASLRLFTQTAVKSRLVVLAAIAACICILSAFGHSILDLYSVLRIIRTIYTVDTRALSAGGDLQYQIQESRHHFLRVLIEAADRTDSLREIALVREADLQVSLLSGKIVVLTRNQAGLKQFERAWTSYVDYRDTMIALALQGRVQEALDLETQHGARAFELASDAIRQAKLQLGVSCSGKVDEAWAALRRACIEVATLCAATCLFALAFVRVELKRSRASQQLQAGAASLRESEERFRSAFEGSTVAIVIMDLHGSIVFTNPAILNMTGYAREELTGLPVQLLIAEEHRQMSSESIARVARGEIESYCGERRLLRKDGQSGWIRVSVTLVRKDAAPAEILALCEDITEQWMIREQLSFQATHDSLTGLSNRRHFERILADEMTHARETAKSLSLLYIDLDGFKSVNDTLGHATGDCVLREASNRFRGCLTSNESIARVGGDEFIVIHAGGASPLSRGDRNTPSGLAKQLLSVIREPFFLNGHNIHVGASIGITSYPEDGESPVLLIQNADVAMYHAKRNESEGFFFFNSEMRDASLRRAEIESKLRGALERKEISIHFQPLYRFPEKTLVRFEALCRWSNPELGNVAPSEFIVIAEEIGMISDIGNWILENSCRQALEWQHLSETPISLAVNVSAAQFAQETFVNSVRKALESTGFPAHLLELELTESTLLRDRAESIRKMHSIRDMGISLSLDDFGTGYSSLSYLQDLPFDALKIDRSFIRHSDSNGTALPMIRSVIAMARALDLRVVIEGIENAHQYFIAQQLGTDEAQGYYLGKPEDAESALECVREEAESLVRRY